MEREQPGLFRGVPSACGRLAMGPLESSPCRRTPWPRVEGQDACAWERLLRRPEAASTEGRVRHLRGSVPATEDQGRDRSNRPKELEAGTHY